MKMLPTVAITVLLTACGGGGGSSETDVSPGGGSTNDALIESDIKYLAASLNLLKVTAASAFLASASNQSQADPNQTAACSLSGSYNYREPNGARPYSELTNCVIAQAPNLTFNGLGVLANGYTATGQILGQQLQYSVINGVLAGSVGAPGQTVSMDVDSRDSSFQVGSSSTYSITRISFRGDQEGAAPTESYVGDFTARYAFDGVQDIVASTTAPTRWSAPNGPSEGVLSLSYPTGTSSRTMTFTFSANDSISAINDNTNAASSLAWTDARLQQYLASTIR